MIVVVTGSDPEERDTYAFALRQVGLGTQQRPRLTDAARGWAREPADLLLALRPEPDDLQSAIDQLRAVSPAPMIALLDSPANQILLDAVRRGCDLVLELPVDPRLVAAYCLNLLRRSTGVPASALPALELPGLRVDPSGRTISVDGGEPVRLTQLEFRLLYLLVTHRGHVVATDDIVERVWGYAETGSPELVRGLVSRLRGKLQDPADRQRFVETHPGVGYRLRVEEDR